MTSSLTWACMRAARWPTRAASSSRDSRAASWLTRTANAK